MSIKIRKANKQDINQIAELVLDLHKLHSRADKRYRLKSEAVCLKYIKKDLIKYFKKPKGKNILVAEKDDKIVSYIDFGIEKRPFNLREKEAWIYTIQVDKKYRRQGIATKLIKEAAKRLKNKGAEEIWISYILKNIESANFWKFFKIESASVNGVISIKNILQH